jgi:hypothetical protein
MPLRTGQPVVLLLSSGGTAARVAAVRPSTIELVLLAASESPLAPGRPVAIEATGPAGVARTHGHVVSDDGRGTVRVQPTGGEDLLQRRDHARATAALDVVVRPVAKPDLRLMTLTRDISAGGALLGGPPELRVGDAAWVTIELGDGLPALEALAECLRLETRGGRAVSFTVVADRDRERLARLVAARQLRARRMAREA